MILILLFWVLYLITGGLFIIGLITCLCKIPEREKKEIGSIALLSGIIFFILTLCL